MKIEKMIKELDRLYPSMIFEDLKTMVKTLVGFIEYEHLDKSFYNYLKQIEKATQEVKDNE